MSNRRRTSTDRARAYASTHPSARRPSRPFGGRARGGPRSYAVLRRLHAMPRWAVPVATAVLVFVGLYAGPVLGGLCLVAVAGFLGWLAYLSWPETAVRGRLARALVLLLVAAVAVLRLLGLWG